MLLLLVFVFVFVLKSLADLTMAIVVVVVVVVVVVAAAMLAGSSGEAGMGDKGGGRLDEPGIECIDVLARPLPPPET